MALWKTMCTFGHYRVYRVKRRKRDWSAGGNAIGRDARLSHVVVLLLRGYASVFKWNWSVSALYCITRCPLWVVSRASRFFFSWGEVRVRVRVRVRVTKKKCGWLARLLSELPEDGDLADLSTVVLEEPAAEEEAVEQCDNTYNAFLTGSFVPSSHVSCAFPTVNQEWSHISSQRQTEKKCVLHAVHANIHSVQQNTTKRCLWPPLFT